MAVPDETQARQELTSIRDLFDSIQGTDEKTSELLMDVGDEVSELTQQLLFSEPHGSDALRVLQKFLHSFGQEQPLSLSVNEVGGHGYKLVFRQTSNEPLDNLETGKSNEVTKLNYASLLIRPHNGAILSINFNENLTTPAQLQLEIAETNTCVELRTRVAHKEASLDMQRVSEHNMDVLLNGFIIGMSNKLLDVGTLEINENINIDDQSRAYLLKALAEANVWLGIDKENSIALIESIEQKNIEPFVADIVKFVETKFGEKFLGLAAEYIRTRTNEEPNTEMDPKDWLINWVLDIKQEPFLAKNALSAKEKVMVLATAIQMDETDPFFTSLNLYDREYENLRAWLHGKMVITNSDPRLLTLYNLRQSVRS